METLMLELAARREILDANLVWRRPWALPKRSTFCPREHFLYYQQEGRRRMADDEGEFSMVPGDVILFAQGHRYASFGAPEAYRAMNILFKRHPEDTCFLGDATHAAPTATVARIQSRLRLGQSPQVQQRFEEIVLLSHASSSLRRAKGEAVLNELLIDLAISSAKGQRTDTNRVEYAVELVEQRVGQPLDLDDVAAQVGMSRRSLTRHFRRRMGTSVQQHHLASRLRVAQSILKTNPDITMREVSDTLGFYDEFHFSRTFRRHCGMSPSVYRRSFEPGQDGAPPAPEPDTP